MESKQDSNLHNSIKYEKREAGGLKEVSINIFFFVLQVLLCEVDSDYSNVPQPVAVRAGPTHLNDSIDRQEFLRESRLLATVRHSNVVKLVGVAMSEEPYCSVLEHSLHGDLYHVLRQISKVIGRPSLNLNGNNAGSTSTSSSGCSSGSPMMNSGHNQAGIISYAKIVDMAAQIACGMKYLETRNIVHKDLAAR